MSTDVSLQQQQFILSSYEKRRCEIDLLRGLSPLKHVFVHSLPCPKIKRGSTFENGNPLPLRFHCAHCVLGINCCKRLYGHPLCCNWLIFVCCGVQEN